MPVIPARRWITRRTRAAAGLTALLLAVTAARSAVARGRLAVLLVADDDVPLGDNLTEAAIAVLAERRDHDLVGLRELRGRLTAVAGPAGLARCFSEAACLTRVGDAAGIDEAVVGNARRTDAGFAIDLALVDLRTGESVARWTQAAPGDPSGLLAALGEGLERLFPIPAPVTPLSSAPAPTSSVTAPSPTSSLTGPTHALELVARPALPPAPLATRHTPAGAYVAFASAALATVAFSAATVQGSIGSAPPTGDTREAKQADLERRQRDATEANALLVAGGVLTAIAAAGILWWWRGEHGRH